MAPDEETRSIKRCCAGGAAPRESWSALWRVCAAELCGTALLVLLSCLPGCARPPPPAAHGALAAGLVVAALVQALDHVSGAMFNPTVTLAALVSRRLPAARAAAMAAAQLCGGAAGALALRALSGGAGGACVTRPAAALGAARAALLEGVLGGCLALVNCAQWDARNRGQYDSWPLRIGGTVAALSLAAGELTGASMNPARSFGPALVQGDFADHWVYWAGPLCGALCFTGAYNALWRAPPHLAPRAAADYEQWERAKAAHAAAALAGPAPRV